MKSHRDSDIPKSYRNPVLDRPCADPFVLKYLNEYWCYSTGRLTGGRCFGAFHSRDLINWRELGGVMKPFDVNASCYWAPEVIYQNGRFYMYYSVGDGEHMHIRVATSDDPEGEFVDAGVRLTTGDFAIDPHVFNDDSGTRYLFYATDFLQHTHIGTGTVCDVMIDLFTLKGEPNTVSRARYDWQVYDPQRKEKGGVRWHTVEGPFVLKRKGLYYQMFSGGNWQNQSYGVGYAISDKVVGEGEWTQLPDGERVVPILRTIPGEVIGPGHNSVVRGPDNLQLFCIYHRWDLDLRDRVLAIDRLDWAGERLLVLGATTNLEPAPNPAALTDFFDEAKPEGLGRAWSAIQGRWVVRDNMAIQEATEGVAEARCVTQSAQFIAEVSVRALKNSSGAFGLKLVSDDCAALFVQLLPNERVCSVVHSSNASNKDWSEKRFGLPDSFNLEAYHLIHVEADGARLRAELDEGVVKWEDSLDITATSVALFTSEASAAFRGFTLSRGWQDLFMEEQSDPAMFGWTSDNGSDRWRIAEKQLWHSDSTWRHSLITKSELPGAYELVVNARLSSEPGADGRYGILPALEDGSGPRLVVIRDGERWAMRCEAQESQDLFKLPDDFNAFEYHQFRFRKQFDMMQIRYESVVLGKIPVPKNASRVGLYASGVSAAFDMVRVVAL